MGGTSLMVEVHEDRVVIKNPGGLPPGVTVNTLTQISIRRNEMIADMFSRIDRAERIGSGIRRIMDLMADVDLPKPAIESNAFYSITFERDPRFKVGSVTREESKIVKDELSARQVKILRVLQSKKLSPREILDALKEDITNRTLRRDLQGLKGKGYVDNEGQLGPKTKWFTLKAGH